MEKNDNAKKVHANAATIEESTRRVHLHPDVVEESTRKVHLNPNVVEESTRRVRPHPEADKSLDAIFFRFVDIFYNIQFLNLTTIFVSHF